MSEKLLGITGITIGELINRIAFARARTHRLYTNGRITKDKHQEIQNRLKNVVRQAMNHKYLKP